MVVAIVPLSARKITLVVHPDIDIVSDYNVRFAMNLNGNCTAGFGQYQRRVGYFFANHH